HKVNPVPVAPPQIPTVPQHPAQNPGGAAQQGIPVPGGAQAQPNAVQALPNHLSGPVNMKLLVISADGNETDFPAVVAFLSQLGIPFDTLIATQEALTSSMLWDG